MRKAKIITATIALVILSGFTYLAVSSGVANQKLHVQTIKLQSTEAKLKDVNLQVEQLKTQSSTDKAKQDQLEKEKKDLEAQLQAKADAKAKLDLAAANTARALTATQSVSAAPVYSGTHEDWMAQAGIAASDYGYVDYIVTHESGWNPNAVNASSGAEGLPQALPYSKTGCAHGDPICQLQWAAGYAGGRYGSWASAYNFWISHRWW